MCEVNYPTLERDELSFLIGSVYVDALAALARRERSKPGLWAAIALSRRIRAGEVISASKAADLLGTTPELIVRQIDRFDQQFKATSRRFKVGDALLAATTLGGGVMAANYWVLRTRRSRLSLIGSAPPKGRSGSRLRASEASVRLDDWIDIEHPVEATQASVIDQPDRVDNLALERPNPEIDLWDDHVEASWHDEIATEPGLEITLQAPDYLISDELTDQLDCEGALKPAPRQARACGSATNKAEAKRAAKFRSWLDDLGAANTGVNIKPLVGVITSRLTGSEISSILTLAQLRNGEHKAVAALEALIKKKSPTRNELIYLRRLEAVLRLIHVGYWLPAPRALPDYKPAQGTILYAIHMRDPYEVNGYVSRTYLVLAAMRAAGYDPIAVTRLGFPNDLMRHRNATIDEIGSIEGVPFIALPDPGNGQMGRPIDEYVDAYAERIVALARKYRPAVLHAASNHLNALATIKAARVLGIRCVYEVRGVWEITQASALESYANTKRYDLQRKLENASVRAADRVITISEPLQRFVIEHGARASNVSVVPNGVDTDRMHSLPRDISHLADLGIAENEVVIGYVGSIVRYEGLDYLLRAAHNLKAKGVAAFKLLIVGDGQELAHLKELARSLDIQEICIFTGRVPRADVERLYAIIHIVPLPRRSLPVTELVPPLKPFEAMAAAKAVIVSSVEAIAGTVIDGETGLVVEKDNIDDLAAALERLIGDPQLRRQMGEFAREWVNRERSVPALATQLRAVYEGLGARSAR